MSWVVSAWGLTDVGRKRPGNEDALLVVPERRLYVVADGMGGHAAGEVASRMAVEGLDSEIPLEPGPHPEETLRKVVERTGRAIFREGSAEPEYQGMGTTLTALWIPNDRAIWAHVGDSRGYRFREGSLEQLTQDHSWVEEQVRAGHMTSAEARGHAMRNLITRSLGYEAEVEVDILVEDLAEGDLLLLCSDGLSGPVPDGLLQETLRRTPPPDLPRTLVDLANERGGPDNITVVAVLAERRAPVG